MILVDFISNPEDVFPPRQYSVVVIVDFMLVGAVHPVYKTSSVTLWLDCDYAIQ